jgi:hypothetical protein
MHTALLVAAQFATTVSLHSACAQPSQKEAMSGYFGAGGSFFVEH